MACTLSCVWNLIGGRWVTTSKCCQGCACADAITLPSTHAYFDPKDPTVGVTGAALSALIQVFDAAGPAPGALITDVKAHLAAKGTIRSYSIDPSLMEHRLKFLDSLRTSPKPADVKLWNDLDDLANGNPSATTLISAALAKLRTAPSIILPCMPPK